MSEFEDSYFPGGETLAGARKRVLLRLLAQREAERLGLTPPPARVQEVARWFRARFDLLRRAELEAFLGFAGLDEGRFAGLMRSMAALDAVQRHHAPAIELALCDHVAVMSVRDFMLLREEAAS